jgi:GT2 family glycosyltransferase
MTLSIIVLSFNTKDLLEKTLGSIPKNSMYEVIVVDNASQDGSAAMVSAKFPHVKLIKLKKNIGFAAGNNVGIKQAKGRYIMLLNSDTEIVADGIELMLDYLNSHPQVGIITPKVLLPDGSIDLACHRGMPTPWNAFTYFSKLESLFPQTRLFGGYHQSYQDFNSIHEVEATAATAMIIKKLVIDKVGLLDEQFFLYAEDLDWCLRVGSAGFSIIYFPRAIVLHHKSRSGKKTGDSQVRRQSQAHFYDTMKQFYQKHYLKRYPKIVTKLAFAAIDIKKYLATKL